jgi:hypothetical protein
VSCRATWLHIKTRRNIERLRNRNRCDRPEPLATSSGANRTAALQLSWKGGARSKLRVAKWAVAGRRAVHAIDSERASRWGILSEPFTPDQSCNTPWPDGLGEPLCYFGLKAVQRDGPEGIITVGSWTDAGRTSCCCDSMPQPACFYLTSAGTLLLASYELPKGRHCVCWHKACWHVPVYGTRKGLLETRIPESAVSPLSGLV